MSEQNRRRIRLAAAHPGLVIQEFNNDMMGCIDAADLVVSMAGYNTICEILSLRKRAIVVPRVRPVQEQWMRAERLAQLGVLRSLHPDHVTPTKLISAVTEELNADHGDRKSTRLNSSHSQISYAAFCLKKKYRYSTTPDTNA